VSTRPAPPAPKPPPFPPPWTPQIAPARSRCHRGRDGAPFRLLRDPSILITAAPRQTPQRDASTAWDRASGEGSKRSKVRGSPRCAPRARR
jgi:hypothetical protein